LEIKRKIYSKILDWKSRSKGKTALLIEGARRVGKSFIIKKFAEKEYKSFILIDFSNVSKELITLFNNQSHDLDIFFMYLAQHFNVQLYNRESIIIFDEIQLFPRARQLIKHLVADGRYDYIESGSLLSIKRNVKNILIPSEEENLKMFPLDFEEFALALNEENKIAFIKTCYEKQIPVGDVNHRSIMNLFKLYLIVGGMPQAVIAYAKTKNFEKVDIEKRNILNLYRSDVIKFAGKNVSKVMAIFDEIPAQLSKHEKKFTLASIEKSARYRTYEDAFIWLSEAMVINTCFNATDPLVGLGLYMDRLTLKCYMGDTGLLIAHTFKENDITSNQVYQDILFDRLRINKGMIYENVVSQMLVANGHKLYFYSRYDKINTNNKMEIDFLLSKEDNGRMRISPVEVKSSKQYTYISLEKFSEKFSGKIGKKYIIHTKDFRKDNDIIFLPVYMLMFL